MLPFPTPNWRASLVATSSTNSDPTPRFSRSASLILPRLYLSDYFTARDDSELARLGITHVISVIEHHPIIPNSIMDRHKLHVCIADRPDVDILLYLEETTEFIRLALAENESNKVLVHCFQGISRSATVVCAYLVAILGMMATESVAFVQAKRGIVCPNMGFRQQLETYSTRFVGRRAQHSESPLANHTSKISGTIAERIRRLKSGETSDATTKGTAVSTS